MNLIEKFLRLFQPGGLNEADVEARKQTRREDGDENSGFYFSNYETKDRDKKPYNTRKEKLN